VQITAGVHSVMELLESPDDSIISSIFNQSIIRRLVELFNKPTGLVPSKLKFEIALIITNLTLGDQEQNKILYLAGALDSIILHV